MVAAAHGGCHDAAPERAVYARLSELRAEVAAQAGAVTEAERDGWLAALRAEQEAGRFLAAGVALFVWGARPA